MSKLTTHVLDTALGVPASGLRVECHRVNADLSTQLLLETVTNADGRCDAPMLSGEDFQLGNYLLRFHAGDYLRATANTIDDAAEHLFLDIIDIRFGITDRETHHHVPLLLSPYGYSTYKGS